MKSKKTLGQRLSSCYLVLILLFIYLPIGYVVLFSFNESKSLTNFTGFSLRWYENMFSDSTMLESIKYTVITAVIATAVSTVVGTVTAIGLSKSKRLIRSLVLEINNLPVMNPDIVTGVSLMLLFVFVGTLVGSGEKLGFHTILIAHITFNLPYVILNVLPKLRQMDVFLTEAALDLGATPMQSFFKVELPAIMPGVFSGLLMAFTLSIDDFVISYYTSDNFETLPIRIYTMVKKPITPKVFSMTSLLFISVLVLMILFNVFQAKAEKKHGRAK